MIRAQAQQLLQAALANPSAEFREGQWEAIDALVNHRQKLLGKVRISGEILLG
ncbi:hypothetical protein [Aeromonas rivipollensis]|uniref:hypothetical protein n=1 Tax=Aeromonas rivipollensis TaxID=948519 RepID=UPI003D25C927